MANDNNERPFVGREEELDLFRRMAADPTGPWLLWIVGPAGQGKSWLLETMLKEAEARGNKTSGLFDFFTDGLRTRSGILIGIRNRFPDIHLSEFDTALAEFQAAVKAKVATEQQKALNRMENKLLDGLKASLSSGQRLVIVADTIELISKLQVSTWFFTRFLPRLKPEVLVVAAGRDIPKEAEKTLDRQSKKIDLGGLTLEQVHEYFRRRAPHVAIEPYMNHVYQVTAGSGQALLIALLVDILVQPYNPNSPISLHELSTLTAEDLRFKLVDTPLLNNSPESRVILALTHIYHGLNGETLPLVAPYAGRFKELVYKLRPLPYIKYHENKEDEKASVIRVHDFFAERARTHVWPNLVQDENFLLRKRLSSPLASYLEKQIKPEATSPEQDHINDTQEKHEVEASTLETASPQQDRLVQQRLYHLLFADRERAYGELWETFDQAWHHLRYDFMDVLLAMARDVNSVLEATSPTLFDKTLDRLEKSARVWMSLEVYPSEDAAKLAEEVIDDSAGVKRLYLTALVAKGTALGRIGEVDQGIAMLKDALVGYKELLALAKTAADGDVDAQKAMESEHGISTVHGIEPERYLILNTIGYYERIRGRFREALDAYTKSYELSKTEGDLHWQASAATQIGNVYGYLGDIPNAFDWVRLGLALRKHEDVKERRAFSLAALGKLQRETNDLSKARNTFTQALNTWQELDAKRDIAEMSMELGWIETLAGNHNEAKEYFAQTETIFSTLGLRALLPSLREKQGRSLIRQAESLPEGTARQALLAQAEGLLREGKEVGQATERHLYAALCLAALCHLAGLRGDYEQLREWERELRQYAVGEYKYQFGPAYADLEQVLGDVAMRQAHVGEPNFDVTLFDQATDHYLQMFIYLVHHNPHYYRERREFLREWLSELPADLRQRAGKRLIEGWEAQPDNLAEEHKGFIRTVKRMLNL